MENQTAAVILAAGDGKRMRSARSKICCEILMKPMLSWVLDSCRRFGLPERHVCAVLSGLDDGVRELLPPELCTAVQSERLGTGHAVRMAEPFLRKMQEKGIQNVCVLYGDVPFLDETVLTPALELHRREKNAVTVLTAVVSDPARYGRIVRKPGESVRIIEAADASAAELHICEINSGVYWFSLDYLLKALPLLKNDNAQKEYYLTDLVGMAPSLGRTAGAFACPDEKAVLGANSRRELAALNDIARRRVFDALYDAGVDIPCTDGILIGPDVSVGPDTTILPGCILAGSTRVGRSCVIGPNTRVIDSSVGDGCVIDSSRIEKSVVKNGVRIGPFSQLRPDCVVEDGVKIGDFVEVKNSTVGERTSLAHLTYIGDSDFGCGINVGCGVVTVNYDGQHKFRTTVKDGAFIGCNTNLIAPVTVGEGAYVAAATTVTKDVSPGAMAIGRVRQEELPGRAEGRIKKK